MKEGGFAYFLNAVHYCIWLHEIWFGNFIHKIVYGGMRFFARCALSRNWRERLNAYLTKREQQMYDFNYDRENGVYIGMANHEFGYLYSCYPGFLSFLMLGLIHSHYGEISSLIKIIAIIGPIGIYYIPAYKAVFLNDRYLRYFREFEKEGEEWHRKWARITWAFCIGAVIVSLCGVAAMLELMIGWENIHLPFLPHSFNS